MLLNELLFAIDTSLVTNLVLDIGILSVRKRRKLEVNLDKSIKNAVVKRVATQMRVKLIYEVKELMRFC